MAQELAASITDDMNQAIKAKEHGFLILPGGSSPRLLIAELAKQKLIWNKITLTTTDERCVPVENPNSNAGQIMKIFKEEGTQISPILLYNNEKGDIQTLPWPADVAVLGMGLDGHIASIFPGMPYDSKDLVITAQAQTQPKARVSLSMDVLLKAKRLMMLVSGTPKWLLCQRLLEDEAEDLPLRHLMKMAGSKLELHIAEKE